MKKPTVPFLDVLGHEEGTEGAKVALVLEEEGLHFSLTPVVDGVCETPLGDHVVSQETPHKVDAGRAVEFCI